MKSIRLFLCLVAFLFMAVSPLQAAFRIGLADSGAVANLDSDQVQQLQAYFAAKVGEPLQLRVFPEPDTLLTWLVRHQAVDLALFPESFLAQQTPGRYLRLASGLGKSGSLVWVASPAVVASDRQKLVAALEQMSGSAAGREILARLGVTEWIPAGGASSAGTIPAASQPPVAAAAKMSQLQVDTEAPAPRPSQLQPVRSPQPVAPTPESPPTSTTKSQAEPLPIVPQAVSKAPTDGQEVGLRQFEVLALQQNLDLQAQQYTTRASSAQLEKNYGLYDPNLKLSFLTGEQRDAANSQYFSALTGVDYLKYSASLTQTISTGAQLQLSLDNSYQDIFTLPQPAFNPEHRGTLTLSLLQPLLKGVGQTITEQQIRFAAYDQRLSIEDLRAKAFSVLGNVRNTYYAAIQARDDLAYRRSSVELARRIVEENRARVEVGAMAKVELLDAEVGLESRQRDLLDAEQVYKDTLDSLALLVNSRQVLEPAATGPLELSVAVDEQAAFESAMKLRPELLRASEELSRIDFERQVNRNSLLPALDVSASYAQKGVADNAGDAYSDMTDEELRSWQIGFNFSMPLGNRAAKGDLRSSELRLHSQRAALHQLRESVRNQIRSAMRAIDLARTKMQVAKRGKQLAEERLQILLGRKEVGLATTRDVLQGEEDLALANTNRISSVADFNNAITSYLQASGQLLDHEGFVLGDVSAASDAPALFSPRQP